MFSYLFSPFLFIFSCVVFVSSRLCVLIFSYSLWLFCCHLLLFFLCVLFFIFSCSSSLCSSHLLFSLFIVLTMLSFSHSPLFSLVFLSPSALSLSLCHVFLDGDGDERLAARGLASRAGAVSAHDAGGAVHRDGLRARVHAGPAPRRRPRPLRPALRPPGPRRHRRPRLQGLPRKI